jgi:hypothetical protein
MIMITLFKYRPFNDFLKPIIANQKIWFPNRSGLNDPEDLQVKIVNDIDAAIYHQFLIKKSQQESWSRKYLQYNLKKAFTRGFKENISTEAKIKIDASQAILQKYFDNLGILSLTDKKDCPDLWKIYADDEKGVCITFKMNISNFLLKVDYETPRPNLFLSKLLLSSYAEKEFIKVLKTKTTKHDYESEWRYFLKNGNNEFPFPGIIDEIMLGRKMDEKNRQIIVKWANKANQPIIIND